MGRSVAPVNIVLVTNAPGSRSRDTRSTARKKSVFVGLSNGAFGTISGENVHRRVGDDAL